MKSKRRTQKVSKVSHKANSKNSSKALFKARLTRTRFMAIAISFVLVIAVNICTYLWFHNSNVHENVSVIEVSDSLYPKPSTKHRKASDVIEDLNSDAAKQIKAAIVQSALPNVSAYADLSTDDRIISVAKEHFRNFTKNFSETFAVASTGKSSYIVSLNGNLYPLNFPTEGVAPDESPKDTTALEDTRLISLVQSAKDVIFNYIRTSSIFKEGEKLIESINNIPVVVARFSGDGAIYGAAMYSYEDDCIYINREYAQMVSEWILTHEYLHALSERTNGGTQNMQYPLTLFEEVITDIILAQLKNTEVWWKELGNSYYASFFDIANWYLACVGVKGIEAYFYGYSDIYQTIAKPELDFFVDSFERLTIEEYAPTMRTMLSTCINKWGFWR